MRTILFATALLLSAAAPADGPPPFVSFAAAPDDSQHRTQIAFESWRHAPAPREGVLLVVNDKLREELINILHNTHPDIKVDKNIELIVAELVVRSKVEFHSSCFGSANSKSGECPEGQFFVKFGAPTWASDQLQGQMEYLISMNFDWTIKNGAPEYRVFGNTKDDIPFIEDHLLQ